MPKHMQLRCIKNKHIFLFTPWKEKGLQMVQNLRIMTMWINAPIFLLFPYIDIERRFGTIEIVKCTLETEERTPSAVLLGEKRK